MKSIKCECQTNDLKVGDFVTITSLCDEPTVCYIANIEYYESQNKKLDGTPFSFDIISVPRFTPTSSSLLVSVNRWHFDNGCARYSTLNDIEKFRRHVRRELANRKKDIRHFEKSVNKASRMLAKERSGK